MPDMPPPTILIVEDEFLIRMMLAETLTDEGYTVAEAGTGDEAMALLQGDARIALLLTDLSLPGGMDGLALARHARRMNADLPIIFMTGRPDAIDRDMLTPNDQVVAKPYLPSEIAAAAHRLLQVNRRDCD